MGGKKTGTSDQVFAGQKFKCFPVPPESNVPTITEPQLIFKSLSSGLAY